MKIQIKTYTKEKICAHLVDVVENKSMVYSDRQYVNGRLTKYIMYNYIGAGIKNFTNDQCHETWHSLLNYCRWSHPYKNFHINT